MERIFLVSNAIELSDFDNLPIKNDNNEIVAIFLGRLIPIKRLDIFLRALALVRKSHPSFKGIVVGDGPERDSGERLALELNLGPSAVSFLGKQSDARVLLSQADMLVLCSRDEGFPNVLLEAMAARLPVVTTPAGDAKFVVDNGVSGYVVPFDDVEEMAGKMYILAKSPELRCRMGEAGRRRVEELYSFDCFARNLLSIYSNNALQSDCAGSLEQA
jgi:glycosyltransferase involved in cell wall biosynthesis